MSIRSTNLVGIEILGWFLTLRYYADGRWGVRCLGGKRYSLDMGRISILSEVYN